VRLERKLENNGWKGSTRGHGKGILDLRVWVENTGIFDYSDLIQKNKKEFGARAPEVNSDRHRGGGNRQGGAPLFPSLRGGKANEEGPTAKREDP